MARAIEIASLAAHVGEEVGVSDWIEVTQARIDRFAEATEDRQWIHVDARRAAAESPYETTIAHGFLTLSLILRSAVRIDGLRMAINYGANRVRFVSAVPAGARIRGRFALVAVDEAAGSWQATWSATIEREGEQKPAAIVEWLVRYYS